MNVITEHTPNIRIFPLFGGPLTNKNKTRGKNFRKSQGFRGPSNVDPDIENDIGRNINPLIDIFVFQTPVIDEFPQFNVEFWFEQTPHIGFQGPNEIPNDRDFLFVNFAGLTVGSRKEISHIHHFLDVLGQNKGRNQLVKQIIIPHPVNDEQTKGL